MLAPDLAERAQLLYADLGQLRRLGQAHGSGATIHTLINQISNARGALHLVESRASKGADADIEELLSLAEACLRRARRLIAQTTTLSAARRHSPPSEA